MVGIWCLKFEISQVCDSSQLGLIIQLRQIQLVMMIIKYKRSLLLSFGFLFFSFANIAQVELDVSNAKDVETAAFICSKSFHISPFQGAGNTSMNDECINNEVNAVWINWESLSVGGTLTFTITPDNPDVNLDFILFESDDQQEITNPDPRKCSTSICEGNTGLRDGAANAQANPGTCNTTTDNGFLSPAIQFQKFYALLVHSTSDDNGFTIEFSGDTEFAGPRPSIQPSIPNEACFGQGVTFSLPDSFDDTDVTSYEWDFGEDASTPTLTTSDIDENPEISYTSIGEKTIVLTVESALGCRVTTEYTLMIEDCCNSNNQLSVDTTLVQVVSCPSDADGAIDIAVTTTSPLDFDILWSNNETTESITGLSAGTFSVTVSNAAGCEATLEDIVLETPDVLKLEIPDIIFDDCRAGAEVLVRAEAEGGRAPYLYNFGQTQDTLPVDNAMLPVGSHLITVKDDSGCTDTTTMSVLLIALEPTTANLQNPPCKDSIGSVDIVELLGEAPYNYDFGAGLAGGADILQALPAGDYVVTVTDANECTGTVEIDINEPEEFLASIDGAGFMVACNGDSSVEVEAIASGGLPPYDYTWEDGSKLKDRENLGAGMYSVTILDANGCVDVDSGEIFQPDALIADTLAINDASCSNTQDGSIQLSIQGGTGEYAFSIDGGTTFEIIPDDSLLVGLSPGNIDIIIKDENDCQIDPISTIINSPSAITTTDEIFDVTNCRDNDNGGIIVTASGGAGDYTYTFTTPTDTFATNNTGQILDSLPIGNYTVFVTDANGCTASNDGIEISEVNLEVEVLSSDNLLCNGDNSGSVELSINGSNNTSDFLFDILNTGDRAGDTILSALPTGDFEIDVYDANGCQGTAPSFSVTEPEAITFVPPSSNRPICFGTSDGSVAISPSGGTGELTVIWSTGDMGNVVSNLPAGDDYTVRVIDENNCSSGEIPFSITENPRIEITNLNAIDVACPDNPNGSISFDVQGGISPYEFSIDGGMTFGSTNILENLTADSYSVIVQDAAGCDTTLEATITSPTNVDFFSLGGGDSCFGDEFSFIATVDTAADDRITNYFWEFGEGASIATATGETPPPVTYTALGLPEIRLIVSTEKCGELAPHIVNGIDNPASFTIQSCCDINGITLTALADSTSCDDTQDGQIRLSIDTDPITLPANIDWESGEDTETLNNLGPGSYSVTVTNLAGCEENTTAIIVAPEALTFMSEQIEPSCGGGTDGRISILAEGGSGNYQYDFGGSGFQDENVVDDFPIGDYLITVIDGNGCRAEEMVSLAEKVLATDPANVTEPTCFGDGDGRIAIQVTNGTSPFEYNINGSSFSPSTALSDLEAGNYSIIIRDAEQCLGSIDVIVTQPDVVDVNMQTVQNISCFGERDGQLRATATGGDNNFSYSWDIGGTNALITNLAPGEYMVTATDGRGCSNTQMGLVVEPDELSAAATGQAVFCFGQTNGAVTVEGLGGTAPYSYSMDGIIFQPVPTFNNLPAGEYEVFVKDDGGCEAEAEATVNEPSEFSIIATQDQSIQLGTEIQLQAVVTDDTGVIYTWSGPDSLSCNDCPNPRVRPSRSGTYFVTATNPGDCSASDTIQVLVSFDRPIYFPQAFSPNGDGINDIFYVQGPSAISVIRKISIFDRFGALLYDQTGIQPNDPTVGWDGIFDGRALPIGVYVVRADVEFIDGEVITYTTDVTIAKNNQGR